MKIQFSPPDITEADIQGVIDTLKSGWITTGAKTKAFEEAIATYCGTERAVCLGSATAAMEQILRYLGIGPGDEVITTAYTYTATASVIHHVGARIVLVDTAPDSYQMDLDRLAAAITPRTKAIIGVDLGGVMCDYDRLRQLAESHADMFSPANPIQDHFGRIIILGDGAHSLGGTFGSYRSGQAADFTTFSFHAVKNLTTGEGGAITWRPMAGLDADTIYKGLMLLSLHGQTKDALEKSELGTWEYDVVVLGYKCNMTDILASLGLTQLQRYGEILKQRRDMISIYDNDLRNEPISILQHFTPDYTSTGHLYLVRLQDRDEAFRNRVIMDLASAGIAVNVHYKPLPIFTAYKQLGFKIADFPNAYAQYANGITLPLHGLLSDDDIHWVCRQFSQAIR
jgi:dTDP-4-amino-4,6-dideoxygalactose transaminase